MAIARALRPGAGGGPGRRADVEPRPRAGPHRDGAPAPDQRGGRHHGRDLAPRARARPGLRPARHRAPPGSRRPRRAARAPWTRRRRRASSRSAVAREPRRPLGGLGGHRWPPSSGRRWRPRSRWAAWSRGFPSCGTSCAAWSRPISRCSGTRCAGRCRRSRSRWSAPRWPRCSRCRWASRPPATRRRRWLFYWARSLLNAFRAVDTLVYALFFVAAVGLGPFPGVLAVMVYTATVLAKLYSEAIEAIEPGPVEAVRATGATTLQVLRWGVLPQLVPQFLSFTLYRFETNIRAAAVLGFVGAGGIGFYIQTYLRLLELSRGGDGAARADRAGDDRGLRVLPAPRPPRLTAFATKRNGPGGLPRGRWLRRRTATSSAAPSPPWPCQPPASSSRPCTPPRPRSRDQKPS